MQRMEKKKTERILFDYWTIMQAHWTTGKTKATSKKSCASRMSDRNGLGPHSHLVGSRSYAKVKDILVIYIFHCYFIIVRIFVLFHFSIMF